MDRQKAKRAIDWAIFGLFTLFISFLASKHEAWADEYLVYFMCKRMGLAELWQAMTREGHFMLWHLLIYPFAKAGFSFKCLQVVSVLLIALSGWLLMMKSPFPTVTKCLILFSYPLLYEFPVIARCYALIPPILFAIACLYKKQKEHLYLYCVLVGLLSLTHAYMEGLVAALFLLFCFEQIYLPYKKGERIREPLLAASLTLAIVFVAFLQVSGSLGYAHDHFTSNTNSLSELWRIYFINTYHLPVSIVQAYCPDHWSNLLGIVGDIGSAACWIVILWMCYKLFVVHKGNRRLILVLLGGIGWQVLMALFVFNVSHQRAYLPLFVLIFSIWCAYEKTLSKGVSLSALCLFLLTAKFGAIIRDIKEPFCTELDCYETIETVVPKQSRLIFLNTNTHVRAMDIAFSKNVAEQMFAEDYDFEFLTLEQASGEDSILLPKDILEEEQSQDNTLYIVSEKALNDNSRHIDLLKSFDVGYFAVLPTRYLYQINKQSNYE